MPQMTQQFYSGVYTTSLKTVTQRHICAFWFIAPLFIIAETTPVLTTDEQVSKMLHTCNRYYSVLNRNSDILYNMVEH